jgi:hypothetical protein
MVSSEKELMVRFADNLSTLSGEIRKIENLSKLAGDNVDGFIKKVDAVNSGLEFAVKAIQSGLAGFILKHMIKEK